MKYKIMAIKIYEVSPIKINADILLSNGRVETINWNTEAERVMALKNVTAYTKIIDTRIANNYFDSLTYIVQAEK